MSEYKEKKDLLVRVALKESRGDGDVIIMHIAKKDDIIFENKYVSICDKDDVTYMYVLSNVLYLKIFTEENNYIEVEEDISTDFKDLGKVDLE